MIGFEVIGKMSPSAEATHSAGISLAATGVQLGAGEATGEPDVEGVAIAEPDAAGEAAGVEHGPGVDAVVCMTDEKAATPPLAATAAILATNSTTTTASILRIRAITRLLLSGGRLID
ncbi:MAG TPA: hypothetical protein VFI12_02920 [Thermomicrobiales bacterium]|nr:hypothetical protein [Thermomicrobiales bacterium]